MSRHGYWVGKSWQLPSVYVQGNWEQNCRMTIRQFYTWIIARTTFYSRLMFLCENIGHIYVWRPSKHLVQPQISSRACLSGKCLMVAKCFILWMANKKTLVTT
jgi:hypothetical protein